MSGYIIRRGNKIICELDGKEFPFGSTAEKEKARVDAQRHADEIIFRQTQGGVRQDATLTERRARLEVIHR